MWICFLGSAFNFFGQTFPKILQVLLQNVSPAHTPDIVVYIDAITIVFEEASKGGPTSSLPIACIEAGNDHSLPNLSLRLFFTPISQINFSH